MVLATENLFDRWLNFTEKKAKLPKLDGSLWHAYRRKRFVGQFHLKELRARQYSVESIEIERSFSSSSES